MCPLHGTQTLLTRHANPTPVLPQTPHRHHPGSTQKSFAQMRLRGHQRTSSGTFRLRQISKRRCIFTGCSSSGCSSSGCGSFPGSVKSFTGPIRTHMEAAAIRVARSWHCGLRVTLSYHFRPERNSHAWHILVPNACPCPLQTRVDNKRVAEKGQRMCTGGSSTPYR